MQLKPSLMIVEDEFLTATYFEIKFKKKEYNVVKVVSNGEDAVKYSIELKPQLILMDIRLAGKMDGIEAASHILSTYQPKIIFVTGYDDKSVMNRITTINYSGYFTKPVDFDTLQKFIEKNINVAG